MRSLPLLEGKSLLEPAIQVSILTRDKALTFVHCAGDIIDISPVSWETKFGGGMGKPSNYNVTLGFDTLDEIKTKSAEYNRAEVTLRIDVGSGFFIPHVGRVVNVVRGSVDPLQMKLEISDRFLDDNPLIPGTSITDSFSGIHPVEADTFIATQGAIEKLGKSAGYPWYYGDESLRDFYMTAVDCDIGELIGPRNVSSESHVSSLFFNSNFEKGNLIQKSNILLINKTWAQQSGSNNFISGGYPFEIMDGRPSDARFWAFGELLDSLFGSVPVSEASINYTNKGIISAAPMFFGAAGANNSATFNILVQKRILQELQNLTRVDFASAFSGVNVPPISTHLFRIVTDSGQGMGFSNLVSDPNSSGLAGSIDTSSAGGRFFLASPLEPLFFSSGGHRSFFQIHVSGAASLDNGDVTLVASINLQGQLKSEGYLRFSIFSPAAESSRIAISENPLAILDHVNSHDTGIRFVELQSSNSQVDIANSNYAFNCFFTNREPAKEIFERFGETTGVGLWLGDSGMLNFRTYINSEGVTIDKTLTPGDFNEGTFELEERPIGSDLGSELARAVEVHYDYDFQRNQFDQVIRAFPANSPACNSIDAAGVSREIKEESKYIMSTEVASLYLGNLVRLHTQDQSFVSGILPAEFFGLELNDVIKVQNQIIVGSESLYQIVKVAHDYKQGTVEFTAGEILS